MVSIMTNEEHVPTCLHCKSTEVAGVERYTRQIGRAMWQNGADSNREIPRVSFTCVACGKPNEYDVPLTL